MTASIHFPGGACYTNPWKLLLKASLGPSELALNGSLSTSLSTCLKAIFGTLRSRVFRTPLYLFHCFQLGLVLDNGEKDSYHTGVLVDGHGISVAWTPEIQISILVGI